MTWVTKYIAHFDNPSGGLFDVRFQIGYYPDTPIELTIADRGISIQYEFTDWFEPIIKLSANINILNNFSSFYTIDDLVSIEEKEWRLIIDGSDAAGQHITLFDGYLNPEIIETTYLNNCIISLTASNYLSKLDYVDPSILYTIQKTAFMNILNDCFLLTGKDASIRVNCTLNPSINAYDETETCFGKTGIDTELFWKNNAEKNTALEIITSILKPFDCYCYWWDNKWYIERYADIYQSDGVRTYCEYDSSIMVDAFRIGAEVSTYDASTLIPIHINDLPIKPTDVSVAFLQGSQQRANIPGLKKLEITLNQNEYTNLVVNNFTNCVSTGLVVPWPSLRSWRDWTEDTMYFSNKGESYQQISNSLTRHYYVYSAGQERYMTERGICTTFKTTVDPCVGTLNISWKYGTDRSCLPGTPTIVDWENYNFYFYYFLIDTYLGKFIKYDEPLNKWYTDAGAVDNTALNEISVKGDNFDEITGTYQCSVTIPLHDVSEGDISGDRTFVFNIGTELVERTDSEIYGVVPAAWAAIGDVIVSATTIKQNNLLTYDISAGTLTKKTIDIDIYDIDNLNYKNGIFYDTSLNTRSINWTDLNAVKFQTLADWLADNKISLYNKNRKKLTGNMHYSAFIKPLTTWYDSREKTIAGAANPKIYLLTGYTYFPGQDEYNNVEFLEYSNDEINIT